MKLLKNNYTRHKVHKEHKEFQETSYLFENFVFFVSEFFQNPKLK